MDWRKLASELKLTDLEKQKLQLLVDSVNNDYKASIEKALEILLNALRRKYDIFSTKYFDIDVEKKDSLIEVYIAYNKQYIKALVDANLRIISLEMDNGYSKVIRKYKNMLIAENYNRGIELKLNLNYHKTPAYLLDLAELFKEFRSVSIDMLVDDVCNYIVKIAKEESI